MSENKKEEFSKKILWCYDFDHIGVPPLKIESYEERFASPEAYWNRFKDRPKEKSWEDDSRICHVEDTTQRLSER